MMQDLRQNKLWGKFCVRKGWKTVEIPSGDGKHRLQAIILPMGLFGMHFLKLQRARQDPDWSEFAKIRRANRVVSSVIEPVAVESPKKYKGSRYKLSNFPYLATKTVVIDIQKSTELLWKGLSLNTKRLINRNLDIEVKKVKPEIFLEYWKKSSKIWTLKISELISLKEIFGKRATFYLCFKDGVCQSGLLLLTTSDTANYYHSFTTSAGRLTGAHFGLVWEAIIEAKKKGLKYFDFEGIYDSRWPQKKWIGFTEFKKKFGGVEVSFPGCFHRWF